MINYKFIIQNMQIIFKHWNGCFNFENCDWNSFLYIKFKNISIESFYFNSRIRYFNLKTCYWNSLCDYLNLKKKRIWILIFQFWKLQFQFLKELFEFDIWYLNLKLLFSTLKIIISIPKIIDSVLRFFSTSVLRNKFVL